MKKLTPTQHGYLDYVTVLLFLAAPSVLGLTGMAGTFSYVLAVIHLAVTLLTDFPLSVYKLIPFEIHGWIERGVGPALILVPFVFGFTGTASGFYVVVGIVIIVVGLMTDYGQSG
jgi:hypothetical protein